MKEILKLAVLLKLIFLFCLFAYAQNTAQTNRSNSDMTAEKWREDLRFLAKTLEQVHPAPYKKISREDFQTEIKRLSDNIPKLSREKIITRMMQLTALLRDGHTTLKPLGANGFNLWFPIRFYEFTDGVYVTAVAPEHKELLGKKIVRIGNLPVLEAARKAASVKSADNNFAEKEGIQYLSNAVALHSLDIINNTGILPVTYEKTDGSLAEIFVESVEIPLQSDSWMYWGEMFSPPQLETIAFHNLPAKEFRAGRKDLPLHLRERLPYWYEILDDGKTIYMQFNFVQNWGDENFAAFYKRMFAEADRLQTKRFILDIRYNSGGDGSMLLPFVHEFIKREYLNQSGKIFTLVGRKTFSAGVMLAALMNKHTESVFVGEPMGAPLNHFGDAGQISLPNSKLSLQVSRIYHQLSSSDDTSRYFSIDIPAVFTAESYFAGRDAALEAIEQSARNKSIPDLFLSAGSKAALDEYKRRAALYQNVDWWRPFSEEKMNHTGYELLEKKRIDDAVAAFELNAKHYPQSWNVWDSLAEAYMAKGDREKAILFYERSLKLNPLNSNAVKMISAININKK